MWESRTQQEKCIFLTRYTGDDFFFGGGIKCTFANWLFAEPAAWNMFEDDISGPDTLG
jgi:hypothetical protein